MSAIGPKQTWASALHMSALGGKADMPFCIVRTTVPKRPVQPRDAQDFGLTADFYLGAYRQPAGHSGSIHESVRVRWKCRRVIPSGEIHEHKILPPHTRNILRRICLQYAPR